jgi:hypothetical protein
MGTVKLNDDGLVAAKITRFLRREQGCERHLWWFASASPIALATNADDHPALFDHVIELSSTDVAAVPRSRSCLDKPPQGERRVTGILGFLNFRPTHIGARLAARELDGCDWTREHSAT